MEPSSTLPEEAAHAPVSDADRELGYRLGAVMLRCLSADGGSAIRVIDESGLTFTQMKVLMTLAGAREQAPSLKPVAEGLGLSLPSASRAVDGLVKRSLVARTEDPDDRRQRLLALTDDGQELADRIMHARLEGLGQFAASLGDEERRRLDRSAGAAARPRGDRGHLPPVQKARRPMTRYSHLITDANSKWWTLGAMCFALFMIMLDNTVVNVALPSIQDDLGSSLSSLEWTINGYTLSFGVLLVTGGRLGDIFGRRRAFLVGVTIFAVSSADRGPRHRHRDARGEPRHPGRRRGADDARDALDRHQRLRAARARQGDRHLGRRLGAGAGDRAGPGRPAHRARLLARDLLSQHPGRGRRRGRDAVRGPRVARRIGRARGSTSSASARSPPASRRSCSR